MNCMMNIMAKLQRAVRYPKFYMNLIKFLDWYMLGIASSSDWCTFEIRYTVKYIKSNALLILFINKFT
jgi:hypothetical protein